MRNLLRWPLLGGMLRQPVLLNVLRWAVLVLFFSAIAFGLIYPRAEENPYTTALFWSLFWPFFLIVTMVTLGPVFCMICPHSFVGKWLTRIGPQKTWPKWLRNPWWGLGLLVISYWIPLYLWPGTLKTPWVAAGYFLVLTLLAWFMFYRYRNMDYCRYLCPIGSVTKAFSKVGFAQLQTDQSQCASCRSFDCVKACQWRLKPYLFEQKNNMQDCTLCMDCAHSCSAVQWNLITPASMLSQPAKQLQRMTVWVFLTLLIVITMTMRFHHALGHSALKSHLPWVQMGQWLDGIMPAWLGIDWTGFSALFMATVFTLILVMGGYWLAARLAQVPFWRVFEHAGLSLGALMLIGALNHVGSFFFLHYAPDLINAFYWLTEQAQTAEPLASYRTDAWLRLFNLFNVLAVVVAAWVLYRQLQRVVQMSGLRFWLAYASAGLVIWGYLALFMLTLYARSLGHGGH